MSCSPLLSSRTGELPSRLPGIRCRGGFTLVELVIAMTVLSIVVTILAGVFTTNSEIFGFLLKSSDDASEVRLAVGRILREVRSIKDNGSVFVANETRLRFVNDVDESIDLSYDARSGKLLLNGRVLAGNLSSFRFLYRDDGGRLLRLPRTRPETDIWTVSVELETSGEPGTRIVTRIHPRNFH